MVKGKSKKSSVKRLKGHPPTSPATLVGAGLTVGLESPDLPVTEIIDGEPKAPEKSIEQLVRESIPVLPYQERWIMDDSNLKIAVWSRQSGKSYAAALRAVIKCLEKRTQYIILSKGERQSRLFMEKVQDFCSVFKKLKALKGFTILPESDEKTMEVYFPHNGSRIIGLPANPDTARGYSGHIVLDEFAFHGDAHKIFAACFPIITRGYSIEVISTPNGTAGKFYEIAKAAGLVGGRSQVVDGEEPHIPPTTYHLPSPLWSGHKVDIYDAVADGLPANIQLLRSGCDDEETWLQEYGCQFLSDAQNYIPVELISTCVHEEATTEWVDGRSQVVGGEKPHLPPTTYHLPRDFYLGVDIGRKRDLTIAWLFEKVGGVLWSRRLMTLKGLSFDEQEKAICNLIEGCPSSLVTGPWQRTKDQGPGTAAIRRVCVDQSGLGMMLAEHLVQKYGALIEPVTFTAPLKERLAPMVKMAFEERTVRIPDNREVRADINSVKRFVTLAGNVRFDAEHTDRGHADRFWALAMVVNAASEPTGHFDEVAGLVGSPVMAGMMEQIL
jgi:phage FluMu gp28-like protein